MPFNIDARLNGAYIAIGMLYGEGDFSKTLEISTRCGQDSDCNPASAGGVLGVISGYKAMDAYWVGGIDAIQDEKFSYTEYSFNGMVASTLKRAFLSIESAGGEVRDDHVIIPKQEPVPPALEQWSMGIPVKSVSFRDVAWQWEGAWTDQEQKSYFNPASKVSEKGGNEAVLTFEGSALAVVGRMAQDGGKTDMYIDGDKVGTANAYIIPGTTDSDLWHIYGLEDGQHTLRMVTLDDADARSDGNRIQIQRVIVFKPE